MARIFLLLGALFALSGVAAGAFGAHFLRSRLPADLLNTFEAGVRYQIYHALGLLAVGGIWSRYPWASVEWAGWLMVLGILIFSGSLYALSLSGIRWLGAVTPLGGLAFLFAWALLAWAVWNSSP